MLKKFWKIFLYIIGKLSYYDLIKALGLSEIIIENNRRIENIIAIVRDKHRNIKQVIEAHNIVTNDGDVWFAQKSASETPTNDFVNLVLGSGSTAAAKTDTYDSMTVITGTEKAPSTGYPKSNDTDADNTGKAIDSITWKYEYTTGDFNHTAIYEGCITVASPAAGSKVLTRWVWGASFEKTSTDTLTIYVNENMLGV